jgi:hypothetical protein
VTFVVGAHAITVTAVTISIVVVVTVAVIVSVIVSIFIVVTVIATVTVVIAHCGGARISGGVHTDMLCRVLVLYCCRPDKSSPGQDFTPGVVLQADEKSQRVEPALECSTVVSVNVPHEPWPRLQIRSAPFLTATTAAFQGNQVTVSALSKKEASPFSRCHAFATATAVTSAAARCC